MSLGEINFIKLIRSYLNDGLVMTMFKQDEFGSRALKNWSKEEQEEGLHEENNIPRAIIFHIKY